MSIHGNRVFYGIWVTVFFITLFMTVLFKRSSVNFQGIAEQKEVVVNWEEPVEIKQIHCIEGEAIDIGQLLVELDSEELKLKINRSSHQLEQLTAQQSINQTTVQSQIDQLVWQKKQITAEISNKIRQLENQRRINQSLTHGLKSIRESGETRPSSLSENPITLQIESLKEELNTTVSPIDLHIDHLNAQLLSTENPLASQIKEISKELYTFQQQRNKLKI